MTGRVTVTLAEARMVTRYLWLALRRGAGNPG
jgi:hypothetical protein